MRKITLGVIMFTSACTLLIIGCTKSQTSDARSNETIKLITETSQKYRSHPAYNNLAKGKASATRTTALVLSDAVGGALGSSMGPFGALWGGFLATLGVEGYVRDPEPKKGIITPKTGSETQSQLFDYGQFGDGHNLLMYNAYTDDITTDLSDLSHFNTPLRNLIINTPFNLTNDGESQQIKFNNMELSFISTQNYILSIPRDQDYTFNLINNSTLLTDTKELLTTITNDLIENSILEGDNFSNYLNDVEDIINNSNYSNQVKYEVKTFIAIANSSNYFWKANFIE